MLQNFVGFVILSVYSPLASFKREYVPDGCAVMSFADFEPNGITVVFLMSIFVK